MSTDHSLALDPFAHLHDEDYKLPYILPYATFRERVATAGRPSLSLNGDWFFTLDLFDEGLRQRWFAQEPLAPEAWKTPRDYDAGMGEKIKIPSCWTCIKPKWRHYEGGAWYTRDLQWEKPAPDSRCVLRVGAANYTARIFLNGQFVAAHRGASTPFFVELTTFIRTGKNRLQIHVDNSRHPAHLPMNHFDWFNDGGLYREIELFTLPSVYIRSAQCALVANSQFNTLSTRIELSDAVDGDAWIEIPELHIRQKLDVRQGLAQAEIPAQPELWSPENPKRYEVFFHYGEEYLRDSIGFREVRCQGPHIFFNGKEIYLKGICVHEDDLALGKVSTEEDVRRRFADAKALGCNFLRLSHYPHHEHVAKIADELGLLLWEEIPVYWAIAFTNPGTFEDASNQLLEMLYRDYNRASVILWGIGNENADSDARYSFMSRLAALVRQHDPSRLIGAACLINREKFCIEDRLSSEIDVIGINEYFGWYEPDFSGLRKLLATSQPDKPVIISETGADAQAGFHSDAHQLYSEECQARIYTEQLNILKDCPYIAGITPWLLYDFRSERRQTVFNQGFNRKGLIAEDKRTRKQAFHVLADFYRNKA